MGTLYMSLNKKGIDKLEEAMKITEVDYGIKDSQIEVDTLTDVIVDLIYEYNKLKERFEELEEDVEENYEYKRLNFYKEYGVSEHDFH